MRIGITGQIGTGKSEVAAIFKNYGAIVISADEVGKDVVENDRRVLQRLALEFGKDILTPTGRLKRRELGKRALNSSVNKKKLNGIVHPPLLKELERRVKAAEKRAGLIVIDAALLIDWGWQKKVDLTVLVHAGRDIKIARLVKKGYTPDEARMRLSSQMKYQDLRRESDLVILNNKDKKHLRKRVEEILQKISPK